MRSQVLLLGTSSQHPARVHGAPSGAPEFAGTSFPRVTRVGSTWLHLGAVLSAPGHVRFAVLPAGGSGPPPGLLLAAGAGTSYPSESDPSLRVSLACGSFAVPTGG